MVTLVLVPHALGDNKTIVYDNETYADVPAFTSESLLETMDSKRTELIQLVDLHLKEVKAPAGLIDEVLQSLDSFTELDMFRTFLLDTIAEVAQIKFGYDGGLQDVEVIDWNAYLHPDEEDEIYALARPFVWDF
ncbi:unnamed protein product [Ambrosiozyma monospora]|uniref:Unnamed protein product n=1 Tax=Ambrosiozyma monospora TaxID=43982 RepID=A0A9W6SXT8_AMBMO|nr:unnamed protein product [Ambrosiozyma monospora]